ncbi:MAG: hypothetical protein IKR34_02235 [Candidatus Gastranaerophilales bacterium]|nr:hypothetical protein [Elusimicrobiota bacterium]MBR6298042.1 hypothetical protein [Candidatus Gastranaerophilales bacterium]
MENNIKLDKAYFESRRAELEIAYNNMKADWQELADHFLPRSVRFLVRNVNKAPAKNKKIKDSATLKAVRNFSSGMMSGATNPATNWFRIRIKNYDIKYDWAVKNWCAFVETIIKDVFNASNFYQKLPSAYKQLGVFALATIALESDIDTVARAKLLPIGSYRYAKNEAGVVDTMCRVYMETAKNLYTKFGEENVSEAVKNCIKNKQYEQMFEVVHFVEPNAEYMPSSVWSRRKKFISVYYEVDGDKEKLLSKSGFDKFPYVVFEGDPNGEDVYPTEGCGINALPDAKQLMSMVVDEGKIVKKICSPQMKGPAELKNKKLTDQPATFTENNQNGDGLQPIYQVPPQVVTPLEALLEAKRQSIYELFFNDLFAMILNTADRGRTATEVNELKEEKMVLLSPILEQVHSGLKTVMEWIFAECMQRGIIPAPPAQIANGELEIEFVSMLAQAQKAQKISAMERFTTFTINLANAIDPALVKKLNGAKIIDDYADFINISPEQVTPTEEVDKFREEQAKKQQQAEQMQQLQQGSEMIKNVGGADAFGGELMARIGL